MKIPFLLTGLLFLTFFDGWGQQQISWRTDNYAGVNSIFINPAAVSTYPLKWDLNIVEAGQFFYNNYAFLHNTNLPELYKNRENLEFVFGPDYKKEPSPLASGTVIADFYEGEKKRYAAGSTFVTGPSFLLNIGENHFAGFFTRARFAFGSQDIPAPFSYYPYDARRFFEPFSIDRFQGSAMAWAEYGLTYTYKKSTATGFLSMGANLKLLRGYEAAFFQINGDFEFTKLPGDSISGSLADIAFGFTNSAIDNYENFKPQVNGSGFGIDAGLMYVFENQSNTNKPYEFKIGFSLLDIGSIRFSENAEKHILQTRNAVIVASDDYKSLTGTESLDDAVKIFSRQILQDSLASKAGNNFTMWLPGALSLQGDYAFNSFFFVNAAVIQRLAYKAPSPETGNLLALTPRFEHRWFGASLPLILYNWQDFRMGATVRLGYLVVGTENLGSFVSRSNLTGADFFFALKFNPFGLNFGDSYASKNFKRKRGKVKCYKF